MQGRLVDLAINLIVWATPRFGPARRPV